MAQTTPSPHTPVNERRRVKVYELQNNDWFDRGTGFCTASFTFNEATRQEDPRVLVHSEEDTSRLLLETRICKDDGFQKQQDTLIVWTEPVTGVDMALSFQESEGCANIWRFISNIQQQLLSMPGHGDDALSDDLSTMDSIQHHVSLPIPMLGNLHDVQSHISQYSARQADREAVAKFIINESYVEKLTELVEMAEDMEDLTSLHRLCTIIKFIILLNDTTIIEHVVSDKIVLGVCGALEYDPDFPSHKANHRQWLEKKGRFKEVVPIKDPLITRKIHQTYRLQYLKDVVLARILDDPTFSVLNSLIFFNQVDIVQHLQTNAAFLKELFGIFARSDARPEQKKEAVLFIQQCCAIAKNLQQPSRQQLYNNFLGHGLLSVINFALRHGDVGVRVGATDVLVSMIDHDPQMIRQTIFRQLNEKQPPLTNSLIDLLLVESDLGVKAQIADAIKVLLDPGPPNVQLEAMSKLGGEHLARLRQFQDPQHDMFLTKFYETSAKKLFQPLLDLKGKQEMDFTIQQVSLFIYLIEILCFFIRQHTHRSKYFVLSENLGQRIAQLLSSKEKYLKLTALKFFRNLIGLQDDFYTRQIIQDKLFEPILNILVVTMSRDNLLNSACLEFFEHIRRENLKPLISHLVETYRQRLIEIKYVDIFAALVSRYDATQGFSDNSMTPPMILSSDDESTHRHDTGRTSRWDNGIKDLDADEENYFNTSDDEDDIPANMIDPGPANGSSPSTKPLVDYTSDEEPDSMDITDAENSEPSSEPKTPGKSPFKHDRECDVESSNVATTPPLVSPPERLTEKRRREEDEEDELGKLSLNKRRTSSGSSATSNSSVLRRKKTFATARDVNVGKSAKIATSIGPALKATGNGRSHGEGAM